MIFESFLNRFRRHPIFDPDPPQREFKLTALDPLRSMSGEYEIVVLDYHKKEFHWLTADENPGTTIARNGLRKGSWRLQTVNEMQERQKSGLSLEAEFRDMGWTDADRRKV